MSKVASKRIIGVDLIKCIACISVILLHVSMPFFYSNQVYKTGVGVNFSQILYYLGTAAVPLFFMANGFFLINRKNMSAKYILNKVLLILIPVFGWNALVFIPKLILNKNNQGYILTVADSLIQKGFFFQFWFLGALIVVLLLVPMLNKLMKYSVKWFAFVMTLFLVISWGIDIYNHLSNAAPEQLHVIQTFRLWSWISYYMTGGLIGHYMKEHNFLVHRRLINWCTVVLTFFVIGYSMINKFWVNNPFAEYNYDNVLIYSWIVLVFIYCLNFMDFSSTQATVIESISKYSFGIYIIHVIVLKVVQKVFPFDGIIYNVCKHPITDRL